MASYYSYVTILNLSKTPLTNGDGFVTAGTWEAELPHNIANEGAWAAGSVRDSDGPTGTTGGFNYHMGYGDKVPKLSGRFNCPVGVIGPSDNSASLYADKAKFKLSLYAVSNTYRAKIGATADGCWSLDRCNWGPENHVPQSGHPLSVLYVIEDPDAE